MSLTGDMLPVGRVDYYEEDKEYKAAIALDLITKDLEYRNGDVRSCLRFDQPPILLTDTLPPEIIEDKFLKLQNQAHITYISRGCINVVIAIIVVLFLWWVINSI